MSDELNIEEVVLEVEGELYWWEIVDKVKDVGVPHWTMFRKEMDERVGFDDIKWVKLVKVPVVVRRSNSVTLEV